MSCLVLSCYTNTVFQSIFFPRFFVGLRRICLFANVLNFEYQHLFIACKNWLCGYETWMKALFSWKKNRLYCSQFCPRNTGKLILGLWNSKIFWESTPPRPPFFFLQEIESYSVKQWMEINKRRLVNHQPRAGHSAGKTPQRGGQRLSSSV